MLDCESVFGRAVGDARMSAGEGERLVAIVAEFKMMSSSDERGGEMSSHSHHRLVMHRQVFRL